MNQKNNNNEFKGFDENSRIIINDNETGQQNNLSNNQRMNNIFTRIQNYLLGLTERLQISSNMKLFLLWK